MAPAPVDPGWSPLPSSFIEWLLTISWSIVAAIGGLLWRLFSGLHRRIAALETEHRLLDHDVKGVRQNQNSLEIMTASRHKENLAAQAELREWLEGRLDRLEDRIEDKRRG